MNYDWDLTYIMDGKCPTLSLGRLLIRLGMTTIEHNIPVSILYDDILTLYTMSGTGSTPTHIVDYGGMFGEQYLWATEDIPNDLKCVFASAFDYVRSITRDQTPHAHTA
jgi:hypothetical protein